MPTRSNPMRSALETAEIDREDAARITHQTQATPPRPSAGDVVDLHQAELARQADEIASHQQATDEQSARLREQVSAKALAGYVGGDGTNAPPAAMPPSGDGR